MPTYQWLHAFEDIKYERIIELVVWQIKNSNTSTVHKVLDVGSRLQTIVRDLQCV